MAEASAEMTAQRTRLLQEAADVWPESPADFAEYYGISRSRLSQLGIRFPQRSKTIIYGPPIQ